MGLSVCDSGRRSTIRGASEPARPSPVIPDSRPGSNGSTGPLDCP